MSRPLAQPQSRRERRAQARLDGPPPARKKITRRVPEQRPTWRSPLVVTSIAAVIVGAVIIFAASGLKLGGSTALVTPATSYAGLPVDGTSVGSANAAVVMKVYSDFQCPACKAFVTTELPQLLRDFVQPGMLRIESNDIDIIDGHKSGSVESLELAAGAFCAEQQGKYWEYHDLVFWNQGGENVGYHDAAFIDRVATAAGLDLAAFHTCQARSDIRQPIKDATTASAKAGIAQTPTLVVGGQVIPGVPAYNQLHSLILQLVAQATAAPAASAAPTTPGPAAPAPTAPSSLPSAAPS